MRSTSDIQTLREKYIRMLSDAEFPSEVAKEFSDELFSLDLTVYSKHFSFDSIIYNSFALSKVDNSVSLHPEQMEIIEQIERNSALIISAPTSFGKTFCIFEYIAKHQPKNVVLIVPTLALIEEYFRKIIRKYKNAFKQYKVHTNVTEMDEYGNDVNNIFILTHDRIVNENLCDRIPDIDFLVIDEVYKLETDKNNDRVLVLNIAYYRLAKKSKKYVLLAPFIGKVEDTELLTMNPMFWRTEYSPVINDVHTIEVLDEKERFAIVQRILNEKCRDEKTLIYFPTVTSLYKYISSDLTSQPLLEEIPSNVQYFIEWAKEEIHDEWCIVKALERGYLVHNGQIPLGTRTFQLDCYDENKQYNRMLCTSTLLEGVNTSAQNIIITRPSRKSNKPGESFFEAFDFFNLVGRTGRLTEGFVGNAYYIKGPKDPVYKKEAAVKNIRFELTDDSKDIDIQKGNFKKYPDVVAFLELLNIAEEDYLENIGVKVRFDSVVAIYNRYVNRRENLIQELQEFFTNKKQGRRGLVEVLFFICGGFYNEDEINDISISVSMITSLLDKRRPAIKNVVNNARQYYSKRDINQLISLAIRIKESYIENSFYNRVKIIYYFLKLEEIEESLLTILDEKIIKSIEALYFTNSKHKKMLLDLGIYERDIDSVLRIIGDDFTDAVELKQRLTEKREKFGRLSYLSKYVIDRII